MNRGAVPGLCAVELSRGEWPGFGRRDRRAADRPTAVRGHARELHGRRDLPRRGTALARRTRRRLDERHRRHPAGIRRLRDRVPPIAGQSIDRYGRKPFLVASFVVLAGSSAAFFGATSVRLVILVRALQGVSAAMYYTVGVTVGMDVARDDRKAAAVSYFSIFLYAGLGVGPVLAEWVLERGGFTAVWSTAILLAMVGLFAVAWIPETGQPGIASRRRFRLLHPGALAPAPSPRRPASVWPPSTGSVRCTGSRWGSAEARRSTSRSPGPWLLSGSSSSDLPDRLGMHRVAVPGMALCVVALVMLAAPLRPWVALLGAALFAVGYAFLFPSLLVLTLARVAPNERAEALGSYTSFLDIALGGGGYLVGMLIASGGFSLAFGSGAALTLVALVALQVDHRHSTV